MQAFFATDQFRKHEQINLEVHLSNFKSMAGIWKMQRNSAVLRDDLKGFLQWKKLTRLKIFFRSLFIMHSIYIHQNHFCTRHILLIIFIPSFHLLLFAVPYVALHISIYLLSFPSSLTSKIFVFATFVCACIRYHLRYSNTMHYGI